MISLTPRERSRPVHRDRSTGGLSHPSIPSPVPASLALSRGRQPVDSTNLVVLRGTLSSDPVTRTCRRAAAGAAQRHHDPRRRRALGAGRLVRPDGVDARRLHAGAEVIVVGHVRRRFFRAGGTTQSRTEVVVERLSPAPDLEPSNVSAAGHRRSRARDTGRPPLCNAPMRLASVDGRMNEQQFQKVQSGHGFIAALDQSGGSTPKALAQYGIDEDTVLRRRRDVRQDARDAHAASSPARASAAIASSARSCSRTRWTARSTAATRPTTCGT